MEAIFWGTRGSVPASLNASQVKQKIHAALASTIENPLSAANRIDQHIEDAPSFRRCRNLWRKILHCVEIRDGDRKLIFDMGSGLRECGRDLLSQMPNGCPIDIDIIMSHMHWDHIQGFPVLSASIYREF